MARPEPVTVATDPLARFIAELSPRQKGFVSRVIGALTTEIEAEADPSSDIASSLFVEAMSDVLRAHHIGSSKPLGKEHFEHAMASVLTEAGHAAELSPMGFPGADITVDGVPWSFKTEAAQSIKPNLIHISKFMELGKGRWDDESDLAALRDRMLGHLRGYERIFDLRYLSGAKDRRGKGEHEYQLVEIPLELLRQSEGMPCSMMHGSRQSPKPGICAVTDPTGALRFELYFDGGTERKLQVRKLRLDLCRVHATWRFEDAI